MTEQLIRPLHEKWTEHPEWCVDPMANPHATKEDYIMAIKQERFSDYVAQREEDALLRRRVIAVLLMGAFICAAAALALSY